MISVNFSDIAILNIKGSDDCCVISLISKNKAIHLIQNADLNKKVEYYKLKKNIYIYKQIKTFIVIYKNGKNNHKIR